MDLQIRTRITDGDLTDDPGLDPFGTDLLSKGHPKSDVPRVV